MDCSRTTPITRAGWRVVTLKWGKAQMRAFARPGGNLTGVAFVSSETAGKRLQFLKEAVPSLTRVAVLALAASAVHALHHEDHHQRAGRHQGKGPKTGGRDTEGQRSHEKDRCDQDAETA